ncbi:MAG: acetyltransferase [Candidatus Omnitrophica bacterium]|nr:acetyltransferase [Candidatus Omnitrophota bacterium]
MSHLDVAQKVSGESTKQKQAKIAIWGASGHALVVAEIIRLRGKYEIVGYLDSVLPQRKGNSFNGSTVLGGEEELQALLDKGVVHLTIAIGSCSARLKLAEKARSLGFILPTLVHPYSFISSEASIGAGTVINAGVIIQPACRLGNDILMNHNATIGHECVIEDGVHIAPGVALGGRTFVKRGTWVGIGSSVKGSLTIGEGCLIGAGSIVVSDIPDRVVAFGIPAKVVRGAKENEC